MTGPITNIHRVDNAWGLTFILGLSNEQKEVVLVNKFWYETEFRNFSHSFVKDNTETKDIGITPDQLSLYFT